MAFAIKGEIAGLKDVLKRLHRLKQGVRNRVLRPAVTKAVKPIAKHAKHLAPWRTGMLRRSMGWRVMAYRRTGTVVGIVGPRSGFKKTKAGRQQTALGRKYKATGINPTRYAHLVELGTVRSAAYAFLAPAWDAGKAGAEATIRAEVEAGIQKLAAGP